MALNSTNNKKIHSFLISLIDKKKDITIDSLLLDYLKSLSSTKQMHIRNLILLDSEFGKKPPFEFENAIEIKYDSSSLPKNGQRVLYLLMDGEIKEGIYNSEDQVFIDDDNYPNFIISVDCWEPLKKKK